jgi:hypothetical protein
VTHLRQLMLDELQRRNYSPSTVRCYIHAVEDFSKYFHRSPERLGPSHIRQYQVHLFRDRKLSAGTIQSRCAALRFLFVKTLRRPYLLDEIPFPKRPRKLPTVLSPEEITRLIESARNLMHRAMLMTLYATGLRRGQSRSRCSIDRQASGDSARVLALDEAQDLSVPRHGEQLAGRCTHHREDRLGRCGPRGQASRYQEARISPHAPTCFGILHHLSEFAHSKGNRSWPNGICGSRWAPRRAASISRCT